MTRPAGQMHLGAFRLGSGNADCDRASQCLGKSAAS